MANMHLIVVVGRSAVVVICCKLEGITLSAAPHTPLQSEHVGAGEQLGLVLVYHTVAGHQSRYWSIKATVPSATNIPPASLKVVAGWHTALTPACAQQKETCSRLICKYVGSKGTCVRIFLAAYRATIGLPLTCQQRSTAADTTFLHHVCSCLVLFVPVLLVPAEVGRDAPGRGACSGLWPLGSQISRLIYFPGALLQLLGAQLETDASVILTPAGTLWHGASIAGCHTVKCAWADSAAALTAPSGKTPPCWCCHQLPL